MLGSWGSESRKARAAAATEAAAVRVMMGWEVVATVTANLVRTATGKAAATVEAARATAAAAAATAEAAG